jgi:hypothetical protein
LEDIAADAVDADISRTAHFDSLQCGHGDVYVDPDLGARSRLSGCDISSVES